MTSSKDRARDALIGIDNALRTSLIVPTDTMITDDIPLLLTKLSGMSYAAGERRPALPLILEAGSTIPASDEAASIAALGPTRVKA